MADKSTIRIFISSPADVRPERLLAERIIARLDREFSYHFHVEAILWEREPLVAEHHFQDPHNIPPPSSADIVVMILWSRLGVPLPESEFRGAISGRQVTGTEWEFEDALAAARQHDGVPSLLVYRKREAVTASLEDEAALDELRRQKKLLEEFIGRWFGSAETNDIVAASHSYLTTPEFEEALYEHLSALLERRAGSLAQRSAIRWHDAPFRGLQSFDLEHAPIFFGRTRARNELRELLARQVEAGARPLLIVSGASGSGKSSLIKAGLLPDLMLPGMLARVALCRYAVVRPSDSEEHLLTALASRVLGDTALPELRNMRYDVERLAALFREAPGQAALPIEQGLAEAARRAGLVETAAARLVLIVDQFEELFTNAAIEETSRREFVTALDALARTNLVWVILTVRGDFIDRLSAFPELSGSANTNAHYFLSPPTDVEFAQIINQPAREAGLRFEISPVNGSSLDETIRHAAAKDPNVLPLLSFLLDELWRNRNANGELTFEAYERLGGLDGALARRADDVFASLPADVQAALPRVLRALVNVESGGQITARTALLRQFPQSSAERKLIDAFTSPEARLLVTGGERGESTVRVTHEALLTHWRRAAEYLAEDRADLEITSRLRRDAARWAAAAKEVSESLLLPSGLPLEEARGLRDRRGDELDDQIVSYIGASSSAEKTRRRTRRSVIVASFVALAVLTTFALTQWQTAEGERRNAEISQSRFLARDAENEVEQGDAVLGMLVALEGLPKEIAHPERPYVVEAEYALEDAAVNQRERKVLRGHDNYVVSAAFSPDGKRIVSASNDNTVRVWDAASGAQISRFGSGKGQGRGYFYAAAYSPDGNRIVTASSNAVRLWDASSGRQIDVLRFSGVVNSATFSPDGKRVVSASDDNTIRIWEPKSGKPALELRGHTKNVLSASFSPDGKYIVSASADTTVRMWNSTSGKQLFTLGKYSRFVWSAAFSPDGKRVVTASDDSTVRVWDVARKTLAFEPRRHGNGVLFAAFSPDGKRIVSGSRDKTVRIWDATSGTQLAVLRGHEGFVWTAAFSPDGNRIVTASNDQTVRLWDATYPGQIAALRAPKSLISAAFSPDGNRLVGASDRTVRVWDAISGKQALDLAGHPPGVKSAVFSPDGQRIVTASSDRTVRVWDASSGKEIRRMTGHSGDFNSAAFSPDGQRIVTASNDKTARVWDASSGNQLVKLVGDGGDLNSAAFSPDGKHIVTSDDVTVRVWDATSGAQITVLRGHEAKVNAAAFSPDGKQVVSASDDQTVCVWDATSGKQLAVLRGHDAHVSSAAFSPDGKRVVSASVDQTVRVWDASTGAHIIVFRGHDAGVRSAAFSPDGNRIVSASDDQTVRVWQMPLREQALIDAVRASLPRQLSDAQRAKEFLASPAP